MPSTVDICNMALSEIGEATIVSLDEASVEARTCKRYFEQCRNFLLEDTNWSFAMRIKPLALLADEKPTEWRYAFAYPSDALTIRYLLPASDLSTYNQDRYSRNYGLEAESYIGIKHRLKQVTFEVMDSDLGKIILTDECEANACYTQKLEDTTKFSTLFVEALVYYLASKIVTPIVGGQEARALKRDLLSMYQESVGAARAHDFNQRRNEPMAESSNIVAKRSSGSRFR